MGGGDLLVPADGAGFSLRGALPRGGLGYREGLLLTLIRNQVIVTGMIRLICACKGRDPAFMAVSDDDYHVFATQDAPVAAVG